MKVVWGVDPGFANIGVAVCDVEGPGLNGGEWCHPKLFQLLTTEPSSKKLKVLSTDDNFRRAQEIAALLEGLARPTLICAEAMSYTPSASASAKVAMVWGVIAGYAQRYQVPVLQVTPQQVKAVLKIPLTKGRDSRGIGSKNEESKLATARALAPRYSPILFHLLKDIDDGLQEHVLDALACVLACEASNEIRMLRRTP